MHALLGGKLRDEVPFASYLFFRYNDPKSKRGEVRTAEQKADFMRNNPAFKDIPPINEAGVAGYDVAA